MLETVLAVLVVTFLFLALFRLSHLLTGKILLEHAAMRVARARAVGLNDFMCVEAARICTIPVAGRRLVPAADDPRTDGISEPALARTYLRTPNGAYANGLLRYEGWEDLRVTPGRGGASHTAMKKDWFGLNLELNGEAEVDGFPAYLADQGL